MANLFKVKNFNFLKYTKPTLILASLSFLPADFLRLQKNKLSSAWISPEGMSFPLKWKKQTPKITGRNREGLYAQGLPSQDLLVRELSPKNRLRLFLSSSIEQPGRPFYGLPLEYDDKDPDYPFATNPRIVWVVKTLSKAGIAITPDSLATLDQSWSSMSGQMSNTMRTTRSSGLASPFFAS